MGARRGEKSGDLLLSVLSSPIWRRTKRPLVIIVPSFFSFAQHNLDFRGGGGGGGEGRNGERGSIGSRSPPFPSSVAQGIFFFSRWTSIDDDDACFAFCVPSPPDFLPRPAAFFCREKGKLSGYIGILAWDLGFFPVLSFLCWHCCADILADCKSVIALGTRSV